MTPPPNWMMTGPFMDVLKASGGGTPFDCISSRKMYCWTGVQSQPPHSFGQL